MPAWGGSKDDDQDGIAAMNAEIERVGSLPLPQLAAEVMARGFGPDGPGGPGEPGTIEAPTMLPVPRTTVSAIAYLFIPPHRPRSIGMDLQVRLNQVIAEGVQLLEHACLVRAESHANAGGLAYVATRLGRSALQRDQVESIVGAGTRLGSD
jgi:hypothetical protein